MLRITVLERGRLIRTEPLGEEDRHSDDTPSRRRLPSHLYDRLLRSEGAREERGEGAVFSWRRNYAIVGPWVGVLQIPGLQVEILPKTDDRESVDATRATQQVDETRQNLVEMLARGGLGAIRARGVASLALKRGTLHDHLVNAFLDRVLHELRRGLDRAYLSDESNLNTLRGKLVLRRHVALNSAHKHRFFCRHDLLSEATAISAKLKLACSKLAGRHLPVALQVKNQLALALLDDVPHGGGSRDTSPPVFNRQNDRFRDIFDFSQMLLLGQAPDPRAGDSDTFSLLFDMDKVFERYIAAFLETNVIPGLESTKLFQQAKGHRLELYRALGGQREAEVLQLQPDLLLLQARPHGATQALIIDTKWKRVAGQNNAHPDNDDLYQLYAYLHRYDCKRAFLLYPKVSEQAPRDLDAMAGRQHTRAGSVGVRFVDLRPKLWTTEGRTALANELSALVCEGLADSVGDAL